MQIDKDYGETVETGTTADDYEVVLDLDTRAADCVCILLKNTGSASTLPSGGPLAGC